MKNIALEVNHVSIDYKNLMHMSLHQSLLKKEVKKADIVRAVNDVSFSVNQGEILGIVGRNGSGKTTLLRSIAGIFQPDEGYIDTKGNRVSLMAIGIGFNPNNTGRENILKSGMLLGCKQDYIKEHMKEIIEFSELGDFIDRLVYERISVKPGHPLFTTIIVECDVVIYLDISEALLAEHCKKRGNSFTDAKNVKDAVEGTGTITEKKAGKPFTIYVSQNKGAADLIAKLGKAKIIKL